MNTLHTIIERHAPPPAAPSAVLQLLAKQTVAEIERKQADLEQVQHQAEQLRQMLAQWEGSGREGADFWRSGLQATQARQQAILREILARLEARP